MQATDVSSLSGVVKEDHGGDHGVLLLWSQDDNGCQPQLVSLPDEISLIQAAVGQAHGLLLGQGGQLYGFERLSPSKPDHLLRTTDSLAEADEKCQARHVLLKDLQETFPERRENSPFSDAVDNEDDLSSKFENGEGVSFSWLRPQPLASLVGRVVISIATGVSHCGVVCQDGAVYMWGKNTEGQCGIRDVPFVGKPTTLTFLGEGSTQGSQNAGDINVTQLSCGESHTLALTRQGELWSWGTGPQIGQGSGVSFSPCPHRVEALRGRRVLQASSGAQHSIALVEVLTVLPSLEPDRCGRCQQLVVTMTDTEDHVLISDEHYCLERGKICLMPENQSTVDFVVESDGNGQGLLEPVSGEQENSSVGGSCSQSMDGVENLLLPSSAVSLERVASDGDKTIGDGTNRQPDCRSLDGAVGAEAPTVPPTLWNRKYWSLVDMRAVRDECSRRLSLPSLLSNLAQVPSMVRRGESHSASVSNPRGSSSDLQHVDESSLLTEVWSWGDGAMGQLGLGDLCPRWQPVCVKAAGRREVVKVAAGAKHSLALTSRGQVFSWGSNYSKQLGLDKPFSAVPCPIKLGIERIARDVAAGRFHSLVLADASSGSTDVLCFGTMGDGPGKSTEHGEPVTLPHPDGLLTAVSGSGERAVGFCCTNPDPILRAMDELCRSEHLFLMRLSQLEEKLKPLLRPGISRATRSSAVDSSLKALGTCFSVLCNLVGQHCRSLADCLAFHLNPMDLLLLNQPEIFTGTYKQYLVALANFFAVDGLESILKTDSEATKNALQNIQEYWPQLNEVPSPAQSFINLLEFPITHVQQYEEFIGKLEISWPKDSVKEQFFSGLHTLWESLVTFWMQQKADAEKTRLFWVSCPTKLSDSLRQPDRRLVRESHCCPLLLQNATRFSIHWFILFNDMFVHVQFSHHQILPLETLWVDATQDSPENSFKIITPEERLLLSTPDAKGKVEWLRLLNRTLDQALSDSTQERTDETKELYRQSLFTSRNVVHTFYRDPRLKRATYQGSWVCGKPHGQGKLMWPDGRQYKGSFKNGLEDGIGELRVPNRLLQKDDVYQGPWKAAKMHGHGVMHYANGDTYEGSFVDGARHGHGMHRSGSFASLSSSIYIGQWFQDRRSGYGVLDDITRGEKYMGMWLDDNRHGQGVVVSQFGLYYEGIFSMNKMAGQGILLAEDNSCFQGEFTADLALNGKGMLTLPSGDQLAGNFSGVWGGELKVTGTFRKTFPGEKEKSTTKPQWGDLAVSPEEKWKGVFAECWALLGCDSKGQGDSEHAWEAIAVYLANGWRDQECRREDISRSGSLNFDKLEVIPQRWEGELTNERHQVIENYLSKACDAVLHPLGRLLDMLVTVYRATYVGVGANKRLLRQAVEEVKSYVRSVFKIVRFLFPELPEGRFVPQTVSSNELPSDVKVKQQCPTTGPLVTHYGLVLPILLPRLYPPLFTIYALQHECRDELYWERVLRLNKQSDVGLLSFLGVQQMFWPIDESLLLEGRQRLSTIRDECFASAVDSLQQISTTFTPSEKLTVIQKTFEEINQSLEGVVQTGYVWSMDDLFPVFLYVVLRARIRNLGSEIHLIEDLMDPFVQHGEQGIMFTTLKACYFQIHKERLT